MAVTSEFMEAVQSGKIMRVRIMLKDSLLIDPTAEQYREMEQYACKQINNIYVTHDGEMLDFDVASWNENYLNQQMVVVVNNFSKERIDLLKGMVRYLYKNKACRIRSERNNPYVAHTITRKQVGTGITVLGAALAVTGVCTSQTILTIGGVAAAAVGVTLIVTDKG